MSVREFAQFSLFCVCCVRLVCASRRCWYCWRGRADFLELDHHIIDAYAGIGQGLADSRGNRVAHRSHYPIPGLVRMLQNTGMGVGW